MLSKLDHSPHLMPKARLTNPLILRIRPSALHPKRPLRPTQKSPKLNAAVKRKQTPKPLMQLRIQPPLRSSNKLKSKRPQVKQNQSLLQNLKQIQQPPLSRNQAQLLLTKILRRLNVVVSQKLFSRLILRYPTMPRSLRKFLLSRLPKPTRLKRQLNPLLKQKLQSNRQQQKLKPRLKLKQKSSRCLKLPQRRLLQVSLRLRQYKQL